MASDSLILDALARPTPAIAYSVSRHLAERFPDRALLEGDESTFDLDSFARAGLCTLTAREGAHLHLATNWQAGRARSTTANGWYAASWNGHDLDVLLMEWQEGYCKTSAYWILAPSREIAEAFFTTVCAWCSEVRGEVLVFAGGRWTKDRELYEAIQDATFDNLVLAGSLKEQLHEDVRSFFASRSTYEEYGVPWKRGILFVGPPGNGKTHAVKALLNSLRVPCLYVKSFKYQYATDHDNIRAVFKRARETTPCFLVLEDLDSLVDGGNRSFFLNELDGFAANTGIVTLATTNHPERLDPSILERPSRFDRKYHFELPAERERRAYLELWNGRLRAAMRLETEAQEELTRLTEGFSFAYLKELVLSSMVSWISTGRESPMRAIMEAQAAALREQMARSPADEGPPPADGRVPRVDFSSRMLGRRGRGVPE